MVGLFGFVVAVVFSLTPEVKGNVWLFSQTNWFFPLQAHGGVCMCVRGGGFGVFLKSAYVQFHKGIRGMVLARVAILV